MRATARLITAAALLAGLALTGMIVAGPVRAACEGDCNNDGEVSIDDLIAVVNVSLGEMPMSACPSADAAPGDGRVTIDEVVHSVRDALYGCSTCTGGGTAFRSTFEAIQTQIFERRGCTATVCHGGPPFQGGLDLRREGAYENLFE